MALSTQTLTQLEACGVTQAHLEALLTVLQLHRNGSWAWHYVNGHLTQCDMRLTFSARQGEVTRVCAGVGDGNALLR